MGKVKAIHKEIARFFALNRYFDRLEMLPVYNPTDAGGESDEICSAMQNALKSNKTAQKFENMARRQNAMGK